MSCTDTQKANNLVFALEDEARHWFSTALREATTEAPLATWQQWQQALRRDFTGEHVRDWVFMQLQERRQQDMLPKEEAVLYLDADILLLRP
ncbi:hypothetical protein HPB47_015956, partial [Ixodes persulcatus]